MRRMATVAISVLALLLTAAGASAARGRRAMPAKCVPSSHVLFADSRVQVYAAHDEEVVSIRGCAYGQRRSFFVAGCNRQEGAAACAASSHVALAGPVVAYEEGFFVAGNEFESGVEECIVAVRHLGTGRVLHKVPTGTPTPPNRPHLRLVGNGFAVAIVVKSDGAVAWINESGVLP